MKVSIKYQVLSIKGSASFIVCLIVFSLILTTYYLILGPSSLNAQEEGATCQYPQDNEVCTGTVQGGICKFDQTGSVPANCQPTGTADQVFGFISVPAPLARIGTGAKGLSNFLSNAYGIIYVAAALVFLFMIIFAAFQWMMAGGDKEAINKSRQRMINAMIGILLLALAGVFFQVFGQITGFEFISK